MQASERYDDVELACPHVAKAQGRISLVGNRCKGCDEFFFPAAKGCTRCRGQDFEHCDFGSEGTLWSWTIQGFLPKQPYNSGETELSFKPYGVGYVEMSSGIKIESRLTVADPALLQIGMPMELTLEPYRTTPQGHKVATFAFRPREARS